LKFSGEKLKFAGEKKSIHRARVRWLPNEKYCRRYLSDGPWTQEHLDRIPFQTLGYYLTLSPFQAVYDNLQGKIQAKTLDSTMQYVAVGMLCTLQDMLGLGLTCTNAQGARSTARWLPEPSECSFLSPQGRWDQQALNRGPARSPASLPSLRAWRPIRGSSTRC
jgi:hypothetical protein